MKNRKPIELDGRQGEGGGQIVRIACALAAVTSQPVRITNIRGKRPNGGGLKDQHVTAIAWLARVTNAQVSGLSVGSRTLDFQPRRPPSDLLCEREIHIVADKPAASALLIFQAVFPLLLFAGGLGAGDAGGGTELAEGSDGENRVESQNPQQEQQQHGGAAGPSKPIQLIISGGTNVSFAPTYEYLDQVLLPELESRFENVSVRRELRSRGWSAGAPTRGEIKLEIQPLPVRTPLRPRQSHPSSAPSQRRGKGGGTGGQYQERDFKVKAIEVFLIAPERLHESLTNMLAQDLVELFPTSASSANDGWGSDSDVEVDVVFQQMEDSGSDKRIHVLLVARSATLRWGASLLASVPKPKNKKNTMARGLRSDSGGGNGLADCSLFCRLTSREVAENLVEEVNRGGTVDCFLQDQLVVFQALADGRTAVPRNDAFNTGIGVDSDEEDEHVETYSLEKAMDKLQLENPGGGAKMRKDKTREPFGQGSMHTRTARWVAAQMLPGATWYNKGGVCDGVGFRAEPGAEKPGSSSAAGPLSVLGGSDQNARAETRNRGRRG